jgi:hypothetical protein
VTPRAAPAAILALGIAVAGIRPAILGAQVQSTTLTVTGGSSLTFAQPTLADYIAGFIDGPTVTFTVSRTNGPNKTSTTTVEICATSATLGSGKPISKLMWQPSDASKPWQSMTSSCAGAADPTRTVAQAVMAKGDSFSSGVKLRMILDWTDTAVSYGATLAMTVDVQTP